MPRTSKKIPSYRLHKTSGQAVVTLSSRDIYLGVFNSKQSRLEYARVILGHRSPQVTEIYAELDFNKASEIMARVG